MNKFQGTIYFNKELFEELLFWLLINRIIQLIQSNPATFPANKINSTFREMNRYIKIADKCGYKGEDFLIELENI